MSGQWGAAAHRGELELVVLTPQHLSARGVPTLPGGRRLLAVMLPDDRPAAAVALAGLPSLARFVAAMQPRSVSWLVGEGETEAEMQAALAAIGDDDDAGVH
jgi:hypothetical protein